MHRNLRRQAPKTERDMIRKKKRQQGAVKTCHIVFSFIYNEKPYFKVRAMASERQKNAL